MKIENLIYLRGIVEHVCAKKKKTMIHAIYAWVTVPGLQMARNPAASAHMTGVKYSRRSTHQTTRMR